jgi:hypothetical protein
MWEKRLVRSESGKIIKFERVKLCPINKYDYEETIKQHLKDIRPRFERFYNYFYFKHTENTTLYCQVKRDLKDYPEFA